MEPSPRWCADCEHAYDGWIRQYASDIIPPTLAGTVIILGFGMGLPLLGASWLVAAAGAFVGVGTLYGTFRWVRHRRRRQFLVAPLPRAYLPE
jgi:hypothetical protein